MALDRDSSPSMTEMRILCMAEKQCPNILLFITTKTRYILFILVTEAEACFPALLQGFDPERIHDAMWKFESHHLTWDDRVREAQAEHYRDFWASNFTWDSRMSMMVEDYHVWREDHERYTWVIGWD
jgi:hypothetical protein